MMRSLPSFFLIVLVLVASRLTEGRVRGGPDVPGITRQRSSAMKNNNNNKSMPNNNNKIKIKSFLKALKKNNVMRNSNNNNNNNNKNNNNNNNSKMNQGPNGNKMLTKDKKLGGNNKSGNKMKKMKKKPKKIKRIAGQCVADHICGTIRGDPHIETFDGMKYDCQGKGEFVIAKSLDSPFEVQGRFVKAKKASITQAISIDTGVEGVLDADIFAEKVNGKCTMNYYIGGDPADFGDGAAYEGIEYIPNVWVGYGKDKKKLRVDYLFFEGSGILLTVTVRPSKIGNKCVLDSKLCLPPSLAQEERIVGLLGTPNGNRQDDWTTSYGLDLEVDKDERTWKKSYEYCTTNWCVKNEEESIFGYLEGTSFQQFNKCSDPYDNSAEVALEDPDPKCVETCGSLTGFDYNACLLECEEGGIRDAQLDMRNEAILEGAEKQCPPVPSTSPSASASDDESPSDSPSASPSGAPSTSPSGSPSASPTDPPTPQPSGRPTRAPTGPPTSQPTGGPTRAPTGSPTKSPTAVSTSDPTAPPTRSPTGSPTKTPTGGPTPSPSQAKQEPERTSVAVQTVDRIFQTISKVSKDEKEEELLVESSSSDDGPLTNSTNTTRVSDSEDFEFSESDDEPKKGAPGPPKEVVQTRSNPLQPSDRSSEIFGDPHFKTWNAAKKFDYHGICDLVLLDHPAFEDGLGLRIHIRTKRMKYASYIETVAVAIGRDTLEFSNDMKNFLINGKKVHKGSKPTLSGYEVRLFKKVISIRLGTKERQYNNDSHIDLAYRVTGFPKVKVVPRNPKTFVGSLGLLGQYPTGAMMGRDGVTEFTDPTEFAQHWQVMSSSEADNTNNDGPMIFSTTRYPQFPTKCTPPKKMLGKRLGDSHMRQTAEKACAAWEDDKEACIFDVMATRSADSADSEEDDIETSVA